MDEGTEYNILDKSEIENIQSDPGFQRAVSNIICSDLNDYGFQVCQQDRITSDTTTQQSLPQVLLMLLRSLKKEMKMKIMKVMRMKMKTMVMGMMKTITKLN